jgi:hypothetical protein
MLILYLWIIGAYVLYVQLLFVCYNENYFSNCASLRKKSHCANVRKILIVSIAEDINY